MATHQPVRPGDERSARAPRRARGLRAIDERPAGGRTHPLPQPQPRLLLPSRLPGGQLLRSLPDRRLAARCPGRGRPGANLAVREHRPRTVGRAALGHRVAAHLAGAPSPTPPGHDPCTETTASPCSPLPPTKETSDDGIAPQRPGDRDRGDGRLVGVRPSLRSIDTTSPGTKRWATSSSANGICRSSRRSTPSTWTSWPIRTRTTGCRTSEDRRFGSDLGSTTRSPIRWLPRRLRCCPVGLGWLDPFDGFHALGPLLAGLLILISTPFVARRWGLGAAASPWGCCSAHPGSSRT